MRSIEEAVPAEALSASLYKISLPPGRDVRGEGLVGDARGLRRSQSSPVQSGARRAPRHIPSKGEHSSERPIVGRERAAHRRKTTGRTRFCADSGKELMFYGRGL